MSDKKEPAQKPITESPDEIRKDGNEPGVRNVNPIPRPAPPVPQPPPEPAPEKPAD